MKALVIGRFQPFHKGHLKIIETVSSDYDEVIIGIGSSQYDNTIENPFSVEERKKMIIKTLEKNDIKNYKIVLIPDIHNPPKWVDHVLSIVTDFDIIISNSPITKQLFSDKGYQVLETPLYDRNKYSGKIIRKKIINNEPWESLVPIQVYKIINEIGGQERLRELSKK